MCAFLRDRDEEYRTLLPFIKEGLEEGDRYEAVANRSVPREGDAVICVYNLGRWGGQALVDVIRTHPQIILDGVLQKNPFFVPPDEFLRDLRTRRPLPDRGSSL